MLGQSLHNGRWHIIGIYMHALVIIGTLSCYHTLVNKDILNSTSGIIIIIRHDFVTYGNHFPSFYEYILH